MKLARRQPLHDLVRGVWHAVSYSDCYTNTATETCSNSEIAPDSAGSPHSLTDKVCRTWLIRRCRKRRPILRDI